MKIPSERRTSDASYAPYPPTLSSILHPHPSQPGPSTNPRPAHSRTPSIAPPPPANNADNSSYKIARAISSCTRCRSRKQKCDGKLPACSACERAKVECIGFDAISKTNVSRNYLHTLEQEIQSLRAQVAALTSTESDPIGETKRTIAANASQALAYARPMEPAIQTPVSYSRPHDLMIDPALQGEGGEPPSRSPWESPIQSQPPSALSRRASDFQYPNTPSLESPKSSPYQSHRPHPTGQTSGVLASSLTRMVHDAALRTGHAQNQQPALGPGSSISDRGSHDSPIPEHSTIPIPEGTDSALASRRPVSSPLATSLSISSGKSKRRQFSVPPLPPQPAMERLVAAYVDFVGVTAPIIHIPSLGKQLIKIREGRDVEQSDIFVVMMMLALSTMASSRFVDPPDELRACSEAFHAEAMKHLDAVFEEQSYVGLQAILLLVWYSLLNPEKGSIWFLVGLATRTCVDLGFHNEDNTQIDRLDALEVDMRRRLFWCTYKMDRLLSQSLGRPHSIPDGFISVPLPSLLHDVDIHHGNFGPLSGEVCSYKAVFVHTIKLRQIQSEILEHTYGIYKVSQPPNLASEEWLDDCFERLKNWLATTPEPRGTVSSEGYAISFHNSALLLYRPSPGSPRPGRKALATVLASSSYIIRIYRRMQLNNRISWLWMTSHFSFMAGLSFLYAFFNLYSMGGGSGAPSLEEAMMDIESCLAVLEYLAPRVPSASACHDTMQTVSKAILEQLASTRPPINGDTNSPGGRLSRGAPISSSRDDPLPNEAFPAPLPPVTLPYELSLLDNLFLNPMSSHNKASDYTNGKKHGSLASEVLSAGATVPGSFGAPQQAFPQGGTFQTNGYNPVQHGMMTNQNIGAYALATQVPGMSNGQNYAMDGEGVRPGSGNGNGNGNGLNGVMGGDIGGGVGQGVDGGFDIFNFLMDEEGGLGGTGNWDALDVPVDFSSWS